VNAILICCVGTGEPAHFGLPEDGALLLKHVGILYVMYGF